MDRSHHCGDGAKLGAGVEVGERRGNGDRDRDGEAIGISLGVSIRVVVRNHCHGLYEPNRLIALVRAFHFGLINYKRIGGTGFQSFFEILDQNLRLRSIRLNPGDTSNHVVRQTDTWLFAVGLGVLLQIILI
jgi:hypothetical protein